MKSFYVRSTHKVGPNETRFEWLGKDGRWVMSRLDAKIFDGAHDADTAVRVLRSRASESRYGHIKVELK